MATVEASLTLADLSSGDDGPRGGGIYSAIISGYEWSDELAAAAVPLGIPVNADVVTLIGGITIQGNNPWLRLTVGIRASLLVLGWRITLLPEGQRFQTALVQEMMPRDIGIR